MDITRYRDASHWKASVSCVSCYCIGKPDFVMDSATKKDQLRVQL